MNSLKTVSDYNIDGREICSSSGAVSVTGDHLSHKINFSMPDTAEGVSLWDKDIKIIYTTPEGYTDFALPVDFIHTDGAVKFSWILEKKTVRTAGKIIFAVRISADEYVWNSIPSSFDVAQGIVESGEKLPEYAAAWYELLEKRMESAEQVAELYSKRAEKAEENVYSHTKSFENPHQVTREQLGLNNVKNIEQASKVDFEGHTSDKDNPHAVTKAQIGLENADNTSDYDKPVSSAAREEFNKLYLKVGEIELRSDSISGDISQVNAHIADVESDMAVFAQELDGIRNTHYSRQVSDNRYLPRVTVNGTSPVADLAYETDAVNYRIYGNILYNGEGTPDIPAEVESVGDLVSDESSTHYGKYKVEIKSADSLLNKESAAIVYLDEPLRKIGNYADYIDFENHTIVRNVYAAKELDLFGSIEISGRYSESIGAYVQFNTSVIPGTIISPNDTVDSISFSSNKFKYMTWGQNRQDKISAPRHHLFIANPNSSGGFPSQSSMFYFIIDNSFTGVNASDTNEQVKTKLRNYLISLKADYYYAIKPSEKSVFPDPLELCEGTNQISVTTATQPSNIEVTYYQNPTLVIEELRNAVLSQGGNV